MKGYFTLRPLVGESNDSELLRLFSDNLDRRVEFLVAMDRHA